MADDDAVNGTAPEARPRGRSCAPYRPGSGRVGGGCLVQWLVLAMAFRVDSPVDTGTIIRKPITSLMELR